MTNPTDNWHEAWRKFRYASIYWARVKDPAERQRRWWAVERHAAGLVRAEAACLKPVSLTEALTPLERNLRHAALRLAKAAPSTRETMGRQLRDACEKLANETEVTT